MRRRILSVDGARDALLACGHRARLRQSQILNPPHMADCSACETKYGFDVQAVADAMENVAILGALPR